MRADPPPPPPSVGQQALVAFAIAAATAIGAGLGAYVSDRLFPKKPKEDEKKPAGEPVAPVARSG